MIASYTKLFIERPHLLRTEIYFNIRTFTRNIGVQSNGIANHEPVYNLYSPTPSIGYFEIQFTCRRVFKQPRPNYLAFRPSMSQKRRYNCVVPKNFLENIVECFPSGPVSSAHFDFLRVYIANSSTPLVPGSFRTLTYRVCLQGTLGKSLFLHGLVRKTPLSVHLYNYCNNFSIVLDRSSEPPLFDANR